MNLDDRDLRTGTLAAWMARQGGVAHSRDLVGAGFTRHDMARAVEAGTVARVRRSWLTLPNVDSRLRMAAAVGGRLTCITAIERRQLWVPPPRGRGPQPPHIAVPHSRAHIERAGVHLHWAAGPVLVSPTTVEDPIVNVLFHVARCLPRGDALAVWESALRHRHADAQVLARIRWRSARAVEIAAVASVLSDSGLETVFVDGMRAIGVSIRQQVRLLGHAVDGLVGDRLVVQIDGFAHHQASERRRDLRHDAMLVLRGYTVVRFDFQQILFDWPYVQATVLTAMAQGLHEDRR